MSVRLIFKYDFLSQVSYAAFLNLKNCLCLITADGSIGIVWSFSLLFVALLDNGACKREIKSTRDWIMDHSYCRRLNIGTGPQSVRSAANETSLQAESMSCSEKKSTENPYQCFSVTNELGQVEDNHDYLIYHSFITWYSVDKRSDGCWVQSFESLGQYASHVFSI